MRIEVSGARPGSQVRLMLGNQEVDWRYQACHMYLNPARSLILNGRVVADGKVFWEAAIPDMPFLAGHGLTFQAAVENGPDSFPQWLLSRGLRLVLGG